MTNNLPTLISFHPKWQHHIGYSVINIIENVTLSTIGAFHIVDTRFGPVKFLVCLLIFQVIGLAFQVKLNAREKTLGAAEKLKDFETHFLFEKVLKTRNIQ
jgi:hypothetical protein